MVRYDVCQICGKILEGREIKKAVDKDGEEYGIFCAKHAVSLYRRGFFSRDYSHITRR
ncbi:MAG: hypothetical protein ACOYWZ_15675 [Bacillota bacterium]